MPFATVAESWNTRSTHFRADRPARAVEVDDALTARRRSLEIAAADKPLSRVAALLLSLIHI